MMLIRKGTGEDPRLIEKDKVPYLEFEALKKHDIYVRFWGSERIEQYLRITVGTKEEMQILFDFLREYINNK